VGSFGKLAGGAGRCSQAVKLRSSLSDDGLQIDREVDSTLLEVVVQLQVGD
jgi:hypothetical protein